MRNAIKILLVSLSLLMIISSAFAEDSSDNTKETASQEKKEEPASKEIDLKYWLFTPMVLVPIKFDSNPGVFVGGSFGKSHEYLRFDLSVFGSVQNESVERDIIVQFNFDGQYKTKTKSQFFIGGGIGLGFEFVKYKNFGESSESKAFLFNLEALMGVRFGYFELITKLQVFPTSENTTMGILFGLGLAI